MINFASTVNLRWGTATSSSKKPGTTSLSSETGDSAGLQIKSRTESVVDGLLLLWADDAS
jgi:hypothetical protein